MNKYSSTKFEPEAKKICWYHGWNNITRSANFSYTCSVCGYHVKKQDISCPGCGRRFIE